MREKNLTEFSIEIETIKETDKMSLIYGGNPIEIDKQDLLDLVYRKIGKYENFTLATNRVKIKRKIRKKIEELEKKKVTPIKGKNMFEIFHEKTGSINALNYVMRLLDKQKDW